MKLKIKDGQQKMATTMTKMGHHGHGHGQGGMSIKTSKIKRTRSYDPNKIYKNSKHTINQHQQAGLQMKTMKNPIKTPLRLNSPKFKKNLYKKYS
jgi:hypothetical protein